MSGVRLLTCSPIKSGYRGFRTCLSHLKIVQFVLSDIGEGIKEVTMRDWFVKVGDTVKQFDDICLVESDKASVNITSRYDGVIKKIYHETGEIAAVGNPLVDIDTEGEESSSGSDTTAVSKEEIRRLPTMDDKREHEPDFHQVDRNTLGSGYTFSGEESKSLATPAVRRIAKEHKIVLNSVKGTGKQGRVLKGDILDYLNGKPMPKIWEKNVGELESPARSSILVGDQVIPISGFKKAMAKAMTVSNQIPSFGYCDELNVTKLVDLRKDINAQLSSEGTKLTYMPFFIKALSKSLCMYPELNAHVDANCDKVTLRKQHNVGFAVDTPSGLLVPNIKGVEMMSILEINSIMNKLIIKSKERRLTIEDLSGGTITISNIGIIGGTYVRPLINPPEVAIVGLGKFRKQPIFDLNNNLIPAYICNASWSADHRVVDGATLAKFAEIWRNYLENPILLTLQ